MHRIEHLDIDTHHEIDHVVYQAGDSQRWVILCFSTECMVLTKAGIQLAKPGDCFIKTPSFIEHHFAPKNAETGFINDWIHVVSDTLGDLVDALALPTNELIHTQNPLILRTYLCKLIHERNALYPFWEQKCSNIVEAMLISLGRTYQELQTDDPKQYRESLLELRNYVKEHLDSPWNVTKMAQNAGLSNSRFSVLYKKRFGRGPNDDLIEMRLEQAKILLISTNKCLADIAQICGFQNEFYFSRIFKSRVNISPGAYRKQL